MKQESLLKDESPKVAVGPVECLGQTFTNDEARRAHFTELLRQKLQDPEFRAIEGFPIGTDEAILELSDPPYYTSCPNPWLNDFVELWESQKVDLDDEYHREPFAADVSEGKSDPIYNAHSYHTKVPHKAIMRYILHYTNPGDIIFDGFCGSGMTGVASQLCGDINVIESLGFFVDKDGGIFDSPSFNPSNKIGKLGVRKTILNDLSPSATFISSNNVQSVNINELNSRIKSVIELASTKFSFMYQTNHNNSGLKGNINYTIWSDVYCCPECTEEVIFWSSAIDVKNAVVLDSFHCQHCDSILTKRNAERVWITGYCDKNKVSTKIAKQVPVLIIYSVDGESGRFSKIPDEDDIKLISQIDLMDVNTWYPSMKIQDGYNTRQPVRSHGLSYVSDFYTKRNLIALSYIYSLLSNNREKFLFTGFVNGATKLNQFHLKNYVFGGGGFSPGPRKGTLYAPSISMEASPFALIKDRLRTQNRAYKKYSNFKKSDVVIGCSSTTEVLSEKLENSVDYIFIDPPFGANLNYSELSLFWEGWLSVVTDNKPEAIENSVQKKGGFEYRGIMTECFKAAYKVLKPDHWMTIEFSNTKASVWNNIQSSLTDAGFIIANVSALDKKQGGINSNVSKTAVRQDLAISAYKPTHELDRNELNSIGVNGVWKFIDNYLAHLTVVRMAENKILPVRERDPRILFDKVITYFVRNNISIPISSNEFLKGLESKYIYRDGMYFLPEQVTEYDKQRAMSAQIQQLSIFVDDEASAIEWMRQELKTKPRTYSEIHPLFLNELSGWKKSELSLELSTLLEQNFIKYAGEDDVPSQIHTYLSTNFKDMRGLDKDDVRLVAKAKDRWYVPDPNKAEDLDKVRLRALLREFETYKTQKKVKLPRAEALRAGFKTAWEIQDFQTILDIAEKIPTDVLQEDEKLLMFYDNALTLTSTEEDEW
ncbi:DNA methyltransferase [Shewanella sp. S1-58-MNA-CIBAN-0166]|uniref:DNA methyltransferase n=1 Tax=Shewanella sp. S1-58-MNA-CIBAN-0166 TaxID=3140467 RepID=UPI00331D4FCD